MKLECRVCGAEGNPSNMTRVLRRPARYICGYCMQSIARSLFTAMAACKLRKKKAVFDIVCESCHQKWYAEMEINNPLTNCPDCNGKLNLTRRD